MRRHVSGNRAAIGGLLAVFGIALLSMEGTIRIAGLLILLGGLVSVVLAFLRRN